MSIFILYGFVTFILLYGTIPLFLLISSPAVVDRGGLKVILFFFLKGAASDPGRLLISLAATFNLSVDSCSSYYLEVSVCKVFITIWFPFGDSYITT